MGSRFLVIICFSIIFNCPAQTIISFKKVFAPIEGTVFDFTQIRSSGYLFTGSLFDQTTAKESGIISKTNSLGNVNWSKKIYDSVPFSYRDNIRFFKIKETDDGSFYTIGDRANFSSPTTLTRNCILSHFDSIGNILWSKEYISGTQMMGFYSLITTSDGNLVVTGYLGSQGIILKIDLNGNIVWSKKYSLGSSPVCYAVETLSGDLLFLSSNGSGIFLIKTDAAGSLIWNKNYLTPYGSLGSEICSIDIDLSGNIFVAGEVAIVNTHPYLAKFDSNGDPLFFKEFRHSFPIMECMDAKVTKDQGVLISFEPEGVKTGMGSQFVLAKVTNTGNIVSVDLLEKNSYSYPYRITKTNDNALAVIGPAFDSSYAVGGNTMFLKLDENDRYPCPNDTALDVSIFDTVLFATSSTSLVNIACTSNTVTLYSNSITCKTYTYCEVKPSDHSNLLPNSFSPNGDGINDLFIINYLYDKFEFKIYDRWGLLQFETNDPNTFWNGKALNGVDAVEGTYFYLLTSEAKQKKGFISLVK